MHKLERPAPPPCLEQYQHGRDRWDGDPRCPCPDRECRQAIWDALLEMQSTICAYCEADINDDRKRHIEHFRQRNYCPEGTFAWPNLFGSCQNKLSCGSHKDKQGNYDWQNIIKPDEEDPEDFFLFGSDGMVHVREGLTPQQRCRAEQTIRVFNLNVAKLVQIRKKVILSYQPFLDDLSAAEEIGDVELLANCDKAIQEILSQSEGTAFCTSIKHLFDY